MTHGEWLKNLLNESIGKFQSFYEDENGFKLPEMEVKDVIMHVSFPYQGSNKLRVTFLNIIVEIEKKDGRMSKVKKFLNEFVEIMLESHMYSLEMSQIYTEFVTRKPQS